MQRTSGFFEEGTVTFVRAKKNCRCPPAATGKIIQPKMDFEYIRQIPHAQVNIKKNADKKWPSVNAHSKY